jgi:hypothetical protein
MVTVKLNSIIVDDLFPQNTMDITRDIYDLRISVAVRFTARKGAEYESALKNAKKQAQYNLYGDLLRQLQLCKSAIYEDDREAAIDALSLMENYMISIY